MSLQSMIAAVDNGTYSGRTLELKLPADLTQDLSTQARAFLEIAFDKSGGFTVLDLTSDKWKHDPTSLDFFFRGSDDERLEILTFLTLFVHEFTHRIDFLISPFGLQYYVNSLREYWLLQEFVPPILDDPTTVEQMRFLVGFSEKAGPKQKVGAWEPLEELIHLSYAWGDVSNVKPLGKYIKKGWSDDLVESGDPFGVDVTLEPVTVLGIFHTFRIEGSDRLWYLRPLTIFETKAVVNSLLFILQVLGEQGAPLCLQYYEELYLKRKEQLPRDYFFLLDLGARIYKLENFHELLKTGHTVGIRSTLLMLSSICWFALHAPPPLKGEDPRVANPITRLLLAFNFFSAYARGKSSVSFNSTAEGLLMLDGSKGAEALFVKSAAETVPDCVRIIDNMLELNKSRTWNPDVRSHFDHIFKLMRPHFAGREPTYTSWLGMPDSGSTLMECRTQDDWELVYEDYVTPDSVKEWFGIRNDLFFNLLKPTKELIEQLDDHYLAFFIPYQCECGQGITTQWRSRFSDQFKLTCAVCGKSKTFNSDEMTILGVKAAKP